MAQEPQNKQREIITVNCGGAGVNIGRDLLEQFALEQGIGASGDKERKTKYDVTIPISFSETSKGKYLARTIFTDLDPYSINKIKTRYPYNGLLHSDYLVAGSRDASVNFAKGHYLEGKELIDSINNSLRTMVESCDYVQGFVFNHSLSGGTGGGLGALILERIAVDYRKKSKFGCEIIPSAYMAQQSNMEIYNSLLSMHWLLDHTDVSFLFDNEQMHELCQRNLKIQHPTYQNYNNLITKTIGELTATSRFAINEILGSVHMDMVPFPRLHFLIASIFPQIPKTKKNAIFKDDVQTLCCQALDAKNFSVKIADFDTEEDKNMALSFGLRGININKYMSQANSTMQFMRSNKKFSYTEWTSAKPMVKFIDDGKPAQLKNDDMLITEKTVSMMMNNTAISRVFSERICKRYDILYAQRAYVCHYVKNGMEEGEFAEAREDLGFLEKDYLDVVSEQQTDSDGDY